MQQWSEYERQARRATKPKIFKIYVMAQLTGVWNGHTKFFQALTGEKCCDINDFRLKDWINVQHLHQTCCLCLF